MIPGLGLPVQPLGRGQVFPYPQVLGFPLPLLPRVPFPRLSFSFLPFSLLLLRHGDRMRAARARSRMMMTHVRRHP